MTRAGTPGRDGIRNPSPSLQGRCRPALEAAEGRRVAPEPSQIGGVQQRLGNKRSRGRFREPRNRPL